MFGISIIMKNLKTIAALTMVVGVVLIAIIVIDSLISTSTGFALIIIGLGVFAVSKNLIPRKLLPLWIVLLVGILTELILFIS